MKQIVRRVIDKKGVIKIEEIPTPIVGENQVLISVHYSLISSGTEMGEITKNIFELTKLTLIDPWMRNQVKALIFGGSLNEKIDIIKNELFLMRLVGYSGSGIVLGKGKNVTHVEIGDHVAFAAQGHAEQVSAFSNHVVKVPENLDLKLASFVTVGGIALQGLRRADVKMGEWVAVYGLGLVGQITVQMLLAAGVRVIGIDISQEKLEIAKKAGVKFTINSSNENPIDAIMKITASKGVDTTIICAVSSDPVIANNSLKFTRKQGKVVFVGIVKMDLERKPFFMNELDLMFSRAYGPGSMNSAYEKGRIDFPYEYVRWTEKRNLDEVIRLLSDEKLNFDLLIDSVYPLDQAQEAFNKVKNREMKSVAIVLSYNKEIEILKTVHFSPKKKNIHSGIINVGVIGAGNFTRNYHIPNLHRAKDFHIKSIASASGLNAVSSANVYPVDYVSSDYNELLNDESINLIIIGTRHDSHASIAIDAANKGKNILLEKPLAMNFSELYELKSAIIKNNIIFVGGYNRRYSEIVKKAKSYIIQSPIIVKYTVNIQHLPDSHWTLDSVEGGGRLIGEAGHFFDLINYFTDSKPVSVQALAMPITEDDNTGLFNFVVQIKYENNSIGQLLYSSNGGASLPRENVEILCGNKHINIIDFRKLRVNNKRKIVKSGIGYLEELAYLAEKIQKGIPSTVEEVEETFWADWISIKAMEQI